MHIYLRIYCSGEKWLYANAKLIPGSAHSILPLHFLPLCLRCFACMQLFLDVQRRLAAVRFEPLYSLILFNLNFVWREDAFVAYRYTLTLCGICCQTNIYRTEEDVCGDLVWSSLSQRAHTFNHWCNKLIFASLFFAAIPFNFTGLKKILPFKRLN